MCSRNVWLLLWLESNSQRGKVTPSKFLQHGFVSDFSGFTMVKIVTGSGVVRAEQGRSAAIDIASLSPKVHFTGIAH
jgi:hypothetical protein